MTSPDNHAEMEAHYAATRDGSAARLDILRDAMARYRSAQDIGAPEFACVTAAVDPILADAGWQGMDTAPKVAKPILLMPGYGIYRSVTIAPVVGHWCEHADGWVSWETGRTIERKPLAWMAIPVLYDAEEASR